MKNILLFSAILILNISYAQSIDVNIKNISAVDLEEIHFKKNILSNIETEIETEVFVLKNVTPTNNTEGKFPFYKEFENKPLENKVKTIVYTQKDLKKVSFSNNIEVNANIALVHKILLKNYVKNELLIDAEKDYKNIDTYKDGSQKDKFNITLYQNNNLELELGNNIYNSINKILKTELDKTLDNSLNLLTFNF